ncbi:MAG TPA: cytochrome c biogenesis protein [Gaiellaceae bacterium]|nr:cytochrome c biogenesis protein [Gaiellaceae bacterium]
MEGTLRSAMHSQRPRLTLSALLALALMVAAVALIAYYAPEDADQGLSQKIFYFHVPIALTAYACFGWAAWKAFRHLSRRQAGADLESYVAVHMGVIFGVLTLATGSIWARISWGVWWTWGSDQLVLFLVLFLFYCAYMMLRFSVADGPQRANLCAVYALFGVVLIPVSFFAIRLSRDLIHPVVFNQHGPQMAGSMLLTLCVSYAALLALASTLYRIEVAGKRIEKRLRDLKELRG